MARKAFNLIFELDVHLVSCPGVCLCTEGKVALKICTLKRTASTTGRTPVFPLRYHEKFVFTKAFTEVRYLAELQSSLANEIFYAELIQWHNQDMGIVLAVFETTLEELLFPTAFENAEIASVNIDLLMDPVISFPGILAPKIHVSTKTIIAEIIKPCTSFKNKSTSLMNPKVLTSKHGASNHHRYSSHRQRKVCHSKNLTEKYSRVDGHADQKEYKYDMRAPFVVRHVDDNIFNYNSPKKQAGKSKHLNVKTGGKVNTHLQQHFMKQPSSRMYDYNDSHILPNNNSEETIGFPKDTNTQEDGYKKSLLHAKNHLPQCCAVCSAYQDYFNVTCCKYTSDFLHKNNKLEKNGNGSLGNEGSHSNLFQKNPVMHTKHNYLENKNHILLGLKKPNTITSSYRLDFYKHLENFYEQLYKNVKSKAA